MRPGLFVLLPAALLAGCSGRAGSVPAPPLPPPATHERGLVVSLTWDAPVDLDLYVTDPTWETAYFANNPTRGGARLENDTRCDTLTKGRPSLERVRIAEASPGPYRVGVDFIDRCGTQVKEVSFRVTADFAGERRESSGKVAPDEFRVIALEFELGASKPREAP